MAAPVVFPAEFKGVKDVLQGIALYDPTHANARAHAKALNKAIQQVSAKALDKYWSKKAMPE